MFCGLKMTRKWQYVGLMVLTSAIIAYIGTSSKSRLQITAPEGYNFLSQSLPNRSEHVTDDWLSIDNRVESRTPKYGKNGSTISKESKFDDMRQGGSKLQHFNSEGPSIRDNSSLVGPLKAMENRNKANGKVEAFKDDIIPRSVKRHVAFLKVHKAASTTLQTMFFRFGYGRNLSFVLPVNGNYFSKSATSHEDIIQPRFGDHYDIICNHGIFSHKIYSRLMPNDTVYLAIVRKPFDQFVSAVHYYSEVYKFKYLVDIPGNKIENLIKHPEKYDKPLSYTMNSMARDFGFNEKHFFSESNKQAKKYLEELGNIFDLVLIAEYFDESLVLMKRLLNWSLKDILYISKNVRGSTIEVGENMMKKFRARNKLDYLVYDFFYDKFEKTLKQSEDSVTAETEHFRHVLDGVQRWCSDTLFGEFTVEASEWNNKFVVTTEDCQLMAEKELKFIKLLKS